MEQEQACTGACLATQSASWIALTIMSWSVFSSIGSCGAGTSAPFTAVWSLGAEAISKTLLTCLPDSYSWLRITFTLDLDAFDGHDCDVDVNNCLCKFKQRLVSVLNCILLCQQAINEVIWEGSWGRHWFCLRDSEFLASNVCHAVHSSLILESTWQRKKQFRSMWQLTSHIYLETTVSHNQRYQPWFWVKYISKQSFILVALTWSTI